MHLLKRYSWVLIILAFVVLIWQSKSNRDDTIQTKNDSSIPHIEAQAVALDEESTTLPSTIIVDVKGEVNEPGIYEMKPGTRVNDAIIQAGGMTENAEQTSVNFAQKIQDEMVILVTSTEESRGDINSTSSSNSSAGIRINQATSEEIQSLQGIGPSKADAIVQYREENGLFRQIDDLLEISGIGEKTLKQIEDDIQVP
ncbi:helix-hairpin-helix domain-containing protein [Halobacillus seohaensis]|uniref:Helix-hairpin-helix domain-containing protein n=1 Tax=Halobacillus seohaensis TaxID=447421 RepID=A0ABW2EGV6_9BACI